MSSESEKQDGNNENKRVLAIFAHSDDELGCVGTLANHADAGDDVTLLFLTKGENATTVEGGNAEVIKKREEHTRKINELLGVKIRYLDFPDSQIEYNVEGGYKISEVIREIKPHIIISWTKYTNIGGGHPDHRHTAAMAFDAINYARYQNPKSKFEPHREPVSFYRYHNPQTNTKHKLQFVDVSHQEEKIRKFIEIYQEAYGDWPVSDFKFSSLRYHGYQYGVEFAEVLEVVNRVDKLPKLLY